MRKRLLISVFALALGISACNEGALPTDAGHLGNPDKELGASTFGKALVLNDGDDTDNSIIDPKPALDPVASRPDSIDGYEHTSEEDNATRYKPKGYEHIKDSFNRSKFKPVGYEHIGRGNHNPTKYKPEGWEHRGATTWPEIDHTKYIPPGYRHIGTGSSATRYQKR
jgi:hypothetical protein